MSAGSPKHSVSHTTTLSPVVVSPQQVLDPSILDSVAGFINEVATNYNIQNNDSKDQIEWIRFEQVEYDELSVLENFDADKSQTSPLLLVLGYASGIQVWAIPISGEATEILSWKHGSVRVLRFLPTPHKIDEKCCLDLFSSKRPLIALCDNSAPGPHFCSLNFLSLKSGEQVKVIKFKNPIVDVLANRKSVVVAFAERIAVFDAFTLEDRLTVTTCYLSPGINPNPIALGTRWMAYAEKKLMNVKKSGGGNEGDGTQSYTATVIHAAKTLGKGLRELGETVASSLTGNSPYKPSSNSGNNAGSLNSHYSPESIHKGIVTILDLEKHNSNDGTLDAEGVVAHFVAHSEAIVCLSFDPSGLLLFSVDKQGHDFHVFRIHPHPGGPALAAVHHLYVLHRGDTTARVQNISWSPDSRWVAVSTLRGTTHVFPVTPYGGNVGVRTHASPHVVNKMSRFHKSAGLNIEGRSHSPVSLFEAPVNSNLPHNNPRLPPYPHPTVVYPLAQVRQPPVFVQNATTVQHRSTTGRQRLGSCSEDNNVQVALRVCSTFAPPRAWFDNLLQPPEVSLNTKLQIKPVESLFIMSSYGNLIQYDLDPHHLASVPKEKVCDETPIELGVTAKAQWMLQRRPGQCDKSLPLTYDNLKLLLKKEESNCEKTSSKVTLEEDRWLSQVEIVTHAGPHRRLWMGPQFIFKTYNNGNGSSFAINETQTIDLGRSKPVNMPLSATYPVVIESGSASSCEQSPKMFDMYHTNADVCTKVTGENRLKEDLADAMLESSNVLRDIGGRCVIVSMKPSLPQPVGIVKVVNPLGTVVTVDSLNEDSEPVEAVNEEENILENCDEALFRPIVSHKFTIKDENKVQPQAKNNLGSKNDKVVPKSDKKHSSPSKLENLSNKKLEKSVVDLNENFNSLKSDNTVIKLPKKEISGSESDLVIRKSEKELKTLNVKNKTDNPDNQSIKSTVILPDVFPVDYKKSQKIDLEIPEVLEDDKINTSINDQLKCIDTKTDYKEALQSSGEDEKGNIEKQVKINSKKSRKPKSKLGIRLNKPKEINNESLIEKSDMADVEVTLTLPKRSWSSIVSQPVLPPPLPVPHLPESDDGVNEGTQLPSIDNALSDLMDLLDKKDDPLEPIFEIKETKVVDTEPPPPLLNIYKSSEEETTESSDDSGKMRENVIVDVDDKKSEEDENVRTTQGKNRSSRRRAKNKKK